MMSSLGLEGSGRGVIKVPKRNLPGRIEENNQKT
jgi:hypothetical protein